MAESQDLNLLASSLVAQDAIVNSDQYRDYRENLTRALATALHRERIAYWVCAVSGVLSFGLTFVGGSGVVGSFDPYSKDATFLSITLAVTCVVSSIAFWLLLASFFSRFRPMTRQAREDLRDLQLLQLATQVHALQKDVASLKEQTKDR